MIGKYFLKNYFLRGFKFVTIYLNSNEDCSRNSIHKSIREKNFIEKMNMFYSIVTLLCTYFLNHFLSFIYIFISVF